MSDVWMPVLAALLLWWAGTGIVILLDRVPRSKAPWTFAFATLFTVFASVCIARTADDNSIASVYAGFSCAVVLWGWHELTFLSGWITGPRRTAATPNAAPMRRFIEAVQVLLWHELALLGTAIALWVFAGQGSNPVAAWTFTLLYVMRVSSKLNLYLGVRNLALDFLPPHLVYLGSYFRQRRFNALMPFSLVLGAAVLAWLLLVAADSVGGTRTAQILLASMLALAIIEHLMMVLPLQPSALWRWALGREAAHPARG